MLREMDAFFGAMKWLVRAFVALFLAMMATCFSSAFDPHLFEPDPYPASLVKSVMDREVAEAKRLGFDVLSSGRGEPKQNWSADQVVSAGRCLALVAGAAHPMFSISIAESDDFFVATYDRDVDRPVGQVQACFSKDQTVRLSAYTLADDPVEWVVLEGSAAKIGGNAALTRGFVPLDLQDAGR